MGEEVRLAFGRRASYGWQASPTGERRLRRSPELGEGRKRAHRGTLRG
jgi:hypothetical protein